MVINHNMSALFANRQLGITGLDLDKDENPYFMERLGVNAVMNSGAIYLNGKYYLVARIEGNDRKSFFGVAESENGIDGFRFWDHPVLLEDTCKEETNVPIYGRQASSSVYGSTLNSYKSQVQRGSGNTGTSNVRQQSLEIPSFLKNSGRR